VRDPVIAAAMDIVKTGRYDDVSRREQLDILVERLDAQQWDLQDAVAAGHADEGAYLLAFAQARAAHAVYFALDADPFIAATEAIYEAQAAIDEIDVIRAVISGVV
jgi:hypothetical protein